MAQNESYTDVDLIVFLDPFRHFFQYHTRNRGLVLYLEDLGTHMTGGISSMIG